MTVMEQVSQQQRVTCCSLECSTWRAAAAAATSSVQASVQPAPPIIATKLDSLLRWLSNRGQHVSSLSLSKAGAAAAPFHPGLLPCTQLQHLTLSKCHLQLTGQSMSHLTSLTRLDLSSCLDPGVPDKREKLDSNICVGFPACLLALTQLTGLQHLHVTAAPVTVVQGGIVQGGRPEFPAGVVSRLAHLTHLDFSGFAVTAAALEHFTRLSDLQHLDFGNSHLHEEAAGWSIDDDDVFRECIVPTETLAALSGLQHLTSLRVPRAECVLGNSRTPGFSTLTALRSLELISGPGLQPSALSDMTALETLTLWDTPLSDDGAQALLGVLPRLQQLTEVCLYDGMCDFTGPTAQYSALVSSSKLEKLMLWGDFLQGAWSAMFDGRRQLPALRIVDVNDRTMINDRSLRTQDLRSLALSCTGLQELILDGSMDPAAAARMQRSNHLLFQ